MLTTINGIAMIILWTGLVLFNVIKIDDSKHLKKIMILELIVLIIKIIQVIQLSINK